MRKILTIISSLALLFLFYPSFSFARVLPRYKTKGTVSRKRVYYSGVSIRPKLRNDHQAIILRLRNLNKAVNVSYSLIYQTNGKQEGVFGMVDSSQGNNLSRELLFGTCSSGVCRYHSGITKMILKITTQLSSGKKIIRRYQIRL